MPGEDSHSARLCPVLPRGARLAAHPPAGPVSLPFPRSWLISPEGPWRAEVPRGPVAAGAGDTGAPWAPVPVGHAGRDRAGCRSSWVPAPSCPSSASSLSNCWCGTAQRSHVPGAPRPGTRVRTRARSHQCRHWHARTRLAASSHMGAWPSVRACPLPALTQALAHDPGIRRLWELASETGRLSKPQPSLLSQPWVLPPVAVLPGPAPCGGSERGRGGAGPSARSPCPLRPSTAAPRTGRETRCNLGGICCQTMRTSQWEQSLIPLGTPLRAPQHPPDERMLPQTVEGG